MCYGKERKKRKIYSEYHQLHLMVGSHSLISSVRHALFYKSDSYLFCHGGSLNQAPGFNAHFNLHIRVVSALHLYHTKLNQEQQ